MIQVIPTATETINIKVSNGIIYICEPNKNVAVAAMSKTQTSAIIITMQAKKSVITPQITVSNILLNLFVMFTPNKTHETSIRHHIAKRFLGIYTHT
jgi:hypothetical protein